MNVDIVLATYQGATYLREQIESILAQDYADWRLLIRDDASTDDTLAIVQAYAAAHPGRIEVLGGERKRLGLTGNFSALLSETTAPYVMCCDQDDVWLPHKISVTLGGMREMEKQCGAEVPLLVHTDAHIVDKALNLIAPSFVRHHQLNPEHNGLNRILVQNTVQGCAAMMNRPLLRYALPLPPVVRMHDMWLALVASGLGEIGYIDQPTLRYRQHATNAVGARKKTLRERAATIQNMMEGNITQAVLFLDRCGDALKPEDRALVKCFSTLPDKGFLRRRILLLRHGFLREPRWQNLAVFALM